MATSKKPVAKTTAEKPTKTAAAAKPGRAPNAAFMKLLQPSKELAAVIGTAPQPRTEVTKLLWEYIKKHNLQNPANKRNILADDKLKPVFGGKAEVSMFEMTKLVSAHLS